MVVPVVVAMACAMVVAVVGVVSLVGWRLPGQFALMSAKACFIQRYGFKSAGSGGGGGPK